MQKITKVCSISVLLPFLAAFSAEEAKLKLNGQWQSSSSAAALSVNLQSGRAVYINAGKKVSGPVRFGELTARTIEMQIGKVQFFVSISNDGNSISVVEEGDALSWPFDRVN